MSLQPQFQLEIRCDNAAFQHPDDDADEFDHQGARADQVVQILINLVQRLGQGYIEEGPLLDTNGNTVGRFVFGWRPS